MPRYLSPEWIDSLDAALRALDHADVTAAAGAGSLAAADGVFSVVQIVTGVPDGDHEVRLVLRVDADGARLERDPTGQATGTATIVLAYPDALALARGELDPAEALAAGRVRVRGDLAALVAGQVVLAEAAARLGSTLDELTDPD